MRSIGTRNSRRRAALASLLGSALLLPALGAGAGAAPAPAAAAVALSVSPAVGHPQQTVKLAGSGWGTAETVKLYFDAVGPAGLRGQVVTASNGSFAAVAVTVPATATPGSHSFVAYSFSSNHVARAAFVVRTDWPQFGFGPEATDANPYENVLNRTNVTQVRERWMFSPSEASLLSTPVEANGLVYVGDRSLSYVYALDAASGALRWQTYIDDEWVTSVPAVANGSVYVVTGDIGTLEALDAGTGAIRWTVGTYTYGTQPVAANGNVYVGGALDQLAASEILAFDGSKGTLRWHAPYVGDVWAADASVVLAELGTPDSGYTSTAAFDASSGKLLWRTVPMGGLAIANGLVYGSQGSTLYARDEQTGAVKWSVFEQGGTWSSTAIAGSTVYVPLTRNGGTRIRGLRATTGQSLLDAKIGGLIASGPEYANGLLYLTTRAGHMEAIDTAGAVVWNAVTGAASSAPLVVNGHLLYTVRPLEFGAVLHELALPTVPAAPALTGIRSGNGWVSVAWEAPSSSGSSAVSSYVVTTSPGGQTATVPATALRAVVAVPNGTIQTVHVQAVNDAGRSDPSNDSAAFTPAASTINVTTQYNATDNTRLLKNATYFGQDAAGAQRTSVAILAYLVGLVHTPDITPVVPPVSSGPNGYTTPWSATDQARARGRDASVRCHAGGSAVLQRDAGRLPPRPRWQLRTVQVVAAALPRDDLVHTSSARGRRV